MNARAGATMPRWFLGVAITALLWNLFGAFAVISDLLLSAADIAALPAEQQALYAARPVWAVAASLVAVVGGTLGCIALLARRRWSLPLFAASLAGAVVQDIGLFGVAGARDVVAFVVQGMVLLVAIGLLLLARRGAAAGWLR